MRIPGDVPRSDRGFWRLSLRLVTDLRRLHLTLRRGSRELLVLMLCALQTLPLQAAPPTARSTSPEISNISEPVSGAATKGTATRSSAIDVGADAGPATPRTFNASHQGRSAGAASPAPKGDEAIRLNYVDAKWDRVLRDVAGSMKKTLVADRVPAGMYSRLDWSKHTPNVALRILNQELERKGFRLLEKGEYLVLVDVSATRQEYTRPTVGPASSGAAADRAVAARRAADGAGGVLTADHHALSQGTTGARSASGIRPTAGIPELEADEGEPMPNGRNGTRPPSRLDVFTPRTGVNAAAPGTANRNEPASPGKAERSVIPLKRQSAVEVSRSLFQAFGSRAALVNEGPSSLPALQILRERGPVRANVSGRASPPPAAPGTVGSMRALDLATTQFLIEIDEKRNELVLHAGSTELPTLVRLVQMLDVGAGVVGRDVKTVATPQAEAIAELLRPNLGRLVALNRQAEPTGRPAVAGAQPDGTPPGPRTDLPPGNDRPPQAVPLPDLIGGIRGDVSVESVPDLGVLIIRGNQKDVDAVMQIIREIERLSAGSSPDLEIRILRHVDAEGLASLLTSVYDRLRTARGATVQQTQTVSVIPLSRPNAILVMAAASDMDSVLKLADELDQPVDPSVQFQVVRLKHAVANQVVTTVQSVFTGAATTGTTPGINIPGLTTGTGGGAGTAAGAAAPTTGGLAPRVRITPDVRTNSVIVQARPRDMQEVLALIRKLDTTDIRSVQQMRVFPLKNALAEEISDTLQQAIQSVISPPRTATGGAGQLGGGGGGLGSVLGGGGGGGAAGAAGGGPQELREARSSAIQFVSGEGPGANVVRSGPLSDIRITAEPRTNSLVVTAPEENLALIEELIRQFDRPSAAVAEIKVFTLVRGDATSTVQLLERLFSQTAQGGGLGGNRAGGGGGQNALNRLAQGSGLAFAGTDDASNTLIPLRFSTDIRTNSIIAVGGPESLRTVEAILYRLDDSDVRQRETTVYRLKNSYAPDVATAVNQFLQGQRQVERADPSLISPFEQIEREVVVVPEVATNNLLISATPRYFKEIRDLVAKLDEAPPQVIIQALLVEVTLDNTDEFGIELGFQDSILFDRSVISNVLQIPLTTTAPNGVQTTTQNVISQTISPGFLFNNQPLGNNPIHSSRVGTQGLSNFSLGRVNSDLGFGGFVLSASSESISVLMRALAVKRRVDILSRPQIRTLDNQLATIQVGQQVPIVDGVNTTAQGNVNPIIRQDQAGIILTVTPRVTPDSMVVMEVQAEKSQFTGAGVPIVTEATTGRTIESPIKDITTARTVISVRDAQTVVLGGMITKTDDKFERKVPFLGDIPILGHAFRYDFKSMRRTELLIFLTPRIIRNDCDSEVIKQIESSRLHYIECEAEMIHGPILAVPEALSEPAFGDPPVIQHPYGSYVPSTVPYSPQFANPPHAGSVHGVPAPGSGVQYGPYPPTGPIGPGGTPPGTPGSGSGGIPVPAPRSSSAAPSLEPGLTPPPGPGARTFTPSSTRTAGNGPMLTGPGFGTPRSNGPPSIPEEDELDVPTTTIPTSRGAIPRMMPSPGTALPSLDAPGQKSSGAPSRTSAGSGSNDASDLPTLSSTSRTNAKPSPARTTSERTVPLPSASTAANRKPSRTIPDGNLTPASAERTATTTPKKTDTTKPDASKSDKSKTDKSKSDATKPDSAKTDKSKTDKSKTDTTKSSKIVAPPPPKATPTRSGWFF